jgi:Flp pilus assembly pilin Flp
MFSFSRLLRDKKGVGTIEYALVVSLISLGVYSGYCSLGAAIQAKYQMIDTALGAVM